MTTQRYGGIDPGDGAWAMLSVDNGTGHVTMCESNPYHYKTVVRTYTRKGKAYQRTCKVADGVDIQKMLGIIGYPGKLAEQPEWLKSTTTDYALCLANCRAVAIEDVLGRGGWSAQSQWTFGESFHTWKALLIASRVEPVLLTPQAWHKLIVPGHKGQWGDGTDKGKKLYSIELCRNLYPDAQLVPDGCKVLNHNRAEAILIAHAAWLLDGERRKGNADD